MTMSRTMRRFLFAMVACAWLVVPTRAETVLSNLGEYTSDTNEQSVVFNVWTGQSFTTDNQAWTLSSATLRFSNARNGSGGLFVRVYGNGTNSPGSLLETLSGNDNPATSGLYTYSSTGLSLAPATTYWLVLGMPSWRGHYNWGYADSDASPPHSTGLWSIPGTNTYASSYNQGASWVPSDGYPQLFSIDATPAPVPEIDPAGFGSVAALLTGSLVLLDRRRLSWP